MGGLDREGQEQEQQTQDMKLERDEQRSRKRRQIESESKRHELELQREAKSLAHEASIKEGAETRQAQLEFLASLKRELGLSAEQMASYVTAKEPGRPDKLIQITGVSADVGSCASSFLQVQTGA